MGTGANTGHAAATAASVDAAEARRTAQAEALGPIDVLTRRQFEHCRFIAHMVSFAQGKKGDIDIHLSVPWQMRDLVMGMIDASGSILSVDVLKWNQEATHEGHAESYETDG